MKLRANPEEEILKTMYRFTLALIAHCVLTVCDTCIHGSSRAAFFKFRPASIPLSFFAMTMVNGNDYPKLTFGTLAHPEIGAWAWIERSKGTYDFTLFDKYFQRCVGTQAG